jgi:hypothetical protein
MKRRPAACYGGFMKKLTKILESQTGAMGWGLLWLIGVPIPILLILFLVRGCT